MTEAKKTLEAGSRGKVGEVAEGHDVSFVRINVVSADFPSRPPLEVEV